MTKEITLAKFYDILEACDWFYEFADDGNAYRRGQQEMLEVIQKSYQSNEHGKLFKDYQAHVFSGDAWGTSKLPKPKKPTN